MRQKKQAILIVFSVVFLFLMSGCGKGGSIIGKTPSDPFLGGDVGLEIEFLEESPPEEVTDVGFPFRAIVSLKNIGEFDLTSSQVKVNLIGFLPSDFGVPKDTSGFLLKNRAPQNAPTARTRDSDGNIIEYVETFVTFPPTSSNTFDFDSTISEDISYNFRAEVCYKYQTKAVSGLCVLENIIDAADDDICDPSGSKNVFSSASPIGVTSFKQTVIGENKIRFSFDIVHNGNGDVFGVSDVGTFGADVTAARDAANDAADTALADVTAARDAANDAADTALAGATAAVGAHTAANTDTRKVIDELVNIHDTSGSKDDIKGVAEEVVAVANDILGNVGGQDERKTAAEVVAARADAVANRARDALDSAIATNNDIVKDAAKVVSDAADVLVEATNSIVEAAGALVDAADALVEAANLVIQLDFEVSCPRLLSKRRSKENKVAVTVDTGLTPNTLKCSGLVPTIGANTASSSGTVLLVNGKRTITCTQDLDATRGDFERNIDITLDFNYLDSVERKILVKHLG